MAIASPCSLHRNRESLINGNAKQAWAGFMLEADPANSKGTNKY